MTKIRPSARSASDEPDRPAPVDVTMPGASTNLNALVALNALLTARNVTRAARAINITQPAMSQALARLRDHFDDPLLVKSAKGLALTPRAEAMRAPLAEALLAVERAIQLGMSFDPSASQRVFRVAMDDISAAMLVPPMLRDVAVAAPSVRMQVEAVASNGRFGERLASGTLDLIVAVFLGGTEGLREEALVTDDFVCLVRRGHPLARRKVARLEDYASHGHVVCTPVDFMPRLMSDAVPVLHSGVHIRASVPYLLAIPEVVRGTDLVGTVPRRLVRAPLDLEGVAVLDAPPELPKVVHAMAWHPRFDADPAHQWLRAQLRSAARQ